MLLLNVVGIIAYRTKVVDKNGGRQFSNFVLEIVTPVLVVNAYADVEYESRLVVNMLWTFLLAAAAYGIFIAAVYLLIRPKPGRETEIERFSAIYSNCGFMGIPLASAILGNEGVFYTTAFLSVFFCFAWTHGIMLLTGQHDREGSAEKALFAHHDRHCHRTAPVLLPHSAPRSAGKDLRLCGKHEHAYGDGGVRHQRGAGGPVPCAEKSPGVLRQRRKAADRAAAPGAAVPAAGLYSPGDPPGGTAADGCALCGNVYAPVPEAQHERRLCLPHFRRHHSGLHADHAAGGKAVHLGGRKVLKNRFPL